MLCSDSAIKWRTIESNTNTLIPATQQFDNRTQTKRRKMSKNCAAPQNWQNTEVKCVADHLLSSLLSPFSIEFFVVCFQSTQISTVQFWLWAGVSGTYRMWIRTMTADEFEFHSRVEFFIVVVLRFSVFSALSLSWMVRQWHRQPENKRTTCIGRGTTFSCSEERCEERNEKKPSREENSTAVEI